MATVKTTELDTKFIAWKNKHQNDVTVLIMSHLIEKAIKKETSSVDELDSLIRHKYSSDLAEDIKRPLLSEIHISMKDIWQWEATYCRPALSSLVVRTLGTDIGLPSPGFWYAHFKTNSIPNVEKLALVKHFHNAVFQFYDICTHNYTTIQEYDEVGGKINTNTLRELKS